MIIKVCGITDVHTALYIEQAGADWIGFVFAPSSRQITPNEAQAICKKLSDRIKKVGVFVNETVENMIAIAEETGLDYIQLHGDEPAEVAQKLPYPVIKAFSSKQLNEHDLQHFPCDYYLIDSPGTKYRGGSGKTFDWNLLDKLNIDKEKLILAGGLSPENVQEAIQHVQPKGVDVSSGVETDGKKDVHKITAFIEQVRAVKAG